MIDKTLNENFKYRTILKRLNDANDGNINISANESLAKRIELIYRLMSPMIALNEDKYGKEIMDIHNKYNEQFLEELMNIKSYDDYDNFLYNQENNEEQCSLAIKKIMNPMERRKKGLNEFLPEQISNISDIWGTALTHFFTEELKFFKVKSKSVDDFSSLTMNELNLLKSSEEFVDTFSKGVIWAVKDNEKVAKEIEKTNINIRDIKPEDFIKDTGFDYLRFPNVHKKDQHIFLSYLDHCCDIASAEYGISKNKLGFNQNGIQLCTTNNPAYYVPSTKEISLRLDMINAFFHEHFHALDHQVLLSLKKDDVENVFNAEYIEYNLASDLEINLNQIKDGSAKNMLTQFAKSIKKIKLNVDEEGKEKDYSEEEQEIRKKHLKGMLERLIREIPEKLKIPSEPFEPAIKNILESFDKETNPSVFGEHVDDELNKLVNPKNFKQTHKNGYVLYATNIHRLKTNMNNYTLFFNLSFIYDNNKVSYFATLPEMLARSAESFFFDKYPVTNITPPEWWENNTMLVYPQNEEKNIIINAFEDVVKSIKENINSFESNMGNMLETAPKRRRL